jgi:hypothetical protein
VVLGFVIGQGSEGWLENMKTGKKKTYMNRPFRHEELLVEPVPSRDY